MLASRTWNAISCNNFAPYPNLIVVVVARTYRRGEPYCGGAAREISVGLEPVAAAPAILGPLHTPPTPVRGDWGLKITEPGERATRRNRRAARRTQGHGGQTPRTTCALAHRQGVSTGHGLLRRAHAARSSHRRNVVTLRLVRYRHHLLENCWRGCRSCSVLMPWDTFRERQKRHERDAENKRELRC
jgi:hypothetical protein